MSSELPEPVGAGCVRRLHSRKPLFLNRIRCLPYYKAKTLVYKHLTPQPAYPETVRWMEGLKMTLAISMEIGALVSIEIALEIRNNHSCGTPVVGFVGEPRHRARHALAESDDLRADRPRLAPRNHLPTPHCGQIADGLLATAASCFPDPVTGAVSPS
ncbi:hypothetical protein [Saccharopolyspora phatthalungensis]|uniref:Uncharacterized protein n=1 Tax=Saccharopolyspora phatthalungensis TaxID=664693 RepID=A0A840QJI4_9PSEU|nr:hypothetical protein [Saccharopolyspora phatthalungensis]MBB5159095.1 hypothetical protein [Saccharopolyspora phatthalungensis]